MLAELRQRFNMIPPVLSGYFVQVGAFADRMRAESIAASLAATIDATS
jgi:hypothetical protein